MHSEHPPGRNQQPHSGGATELKGRQPRAVILGVGNELTEGRTQDVHARYLAVFLRELHIEVVRVSLIPDAYELYVEELRRASAEADLVLATGGLGPTSDDLTREVFAEVSGCALEYHEDLWEQLKARFPRRKISETNKKQVMIPAGFTIFANANGTAPAFGGVMGETLLVALPGPPRELTPIVEEQVRPFLAERFAVVPEKALRATALMVPESDLEEAIQRRARMHADAEPPHADAEQSYRQRMWDDTASQQEHSTPLNWGTRAELYRISFVLRGGTDAQRDAVFRGVREDLGESRIHQGDTSAPKLLLERCREAGRMLATAESCTGGLITTLLTDIPGSSAVVWGGVTAYANEVKEQILGVPGELLARHGAVSEEVAASMARGVLALANGTASGGIRGVGAQSSGSAPADEGPGGDGTAGIGVVDLGIAVTGVAGPGGGTPEKPVGTVWIAAARREGETTTRLLSLPASRDRVRRWTAISAMLLAYEVMTVDMPPRA